MLQKKYIIPIEDFRSLFGTKGGFGVAQLIFTFPHKSFHLRQLAEELNFSTTAVTEGIDILMKYNIINVEEGPTTKNIKANLSSESYKDYKLIFNLFLLKRYNVLYNLTAFFHNPECIVVFGSFARGEDIEESDIDILIIASGEPSPDLKYFVKIWEKAFNRKINIHKLKSLDKAENSFKNAVANGITLYGYLNVIQ